MCEKLSVLLAVGRPLLRKLLEDSLQKESDIEVLDAVDTADRAIEGVRYCTPEIVLMDTDLPGWLEATRTILNNNHSPNLVYFGDRIRDRDISQVLQQNNFGFVTTHDSRFDLIQALRDVSKGRRYISSRIQKRIVKIDGRQHPMNQNLSRIDTLTLREIEILKYLSLGMSKKEVARTMHISVNTVNRHASSLMEKLDIHDRVHLARFAIREGIVDV